jgi:hypothetical protein
MLILGLLVKQAIPWASVMGKVGPLKPTEFFIKRMVTKGKRSVHKLSGAVHFMKKCAVPLCTCQISGGKEFCSAECRNGLPTGTCHCPHSDCRSH